MLAGRVGQGLLGPTAAPTDLQAGAHSDFDIHIGFGISAIDNVKDLTIDLPPGEIGDPNATPFCSVRQLNAHSCPADTKVGTASTGVAVLGLFPIQPVTGNIYNVQPQPGEPARFGIVSRRWMFLLRSPTSSPIVLQSPVQLRQTDYGLSTVVNNIPNSAEVLDGFSIPISITSMDLRLMGVAPGTGRPFMRNPTSCTPHGANFIADSYWGGTATTPAIGHSDSFTPTSCGNLDFSPTLTARLGGQRATGQPTTAITSIDQDPDEPGLLRAQVVIPPDVSPDLYLVGNLCSPTDFQASSCPANSVMGSATAASPLLSQPLGGPVMLVESGGVPNLGLDLRGQLHLLLQGALSLDKKVTFDGLPDIPITHFQLTFTPSPGLLLANRDLCVPPAPIFHADVLGYNGATASVDSAATVEGCGGVLGAKNKHKKRSCKKKHKGHHRKCKKGKKHRKHRAAEVGLWLQAQTRAAPGQEQTSKEPSRVAREAPETTGAAPARG